MTLPLKPRYITRNISMLYKAHGPLFSFRVLSRIAEYIYCILFREKHFTFDGKEYSYFFHLENPTFRIERCVEIPIIMSHVNTLTDGDMLEVGNALQNYTSFPHDIVDKYEEDDNVQNIDIVDFKPDKKYDLIISISTLEHVGWDETPREPEKVLHAIEHLKSLLKPGGKMVATVPTGYNDKLDELIGDNKTGMDRVCFLKRISADNKWVQADYDEIKDIRYGGKYICANSLAIGYYTNNGGNA